MLSHTRLTNAATGERASAVRPRLGSDSEHRQRIVRGTLQHFLGLLVAVSLTSCASGAPSGDPIRSTRPADQCQAAVDSARAGLIATQPPEPRVIRLPEYIPANAPQRRKATVTFDIDTAGRVVADRIRVTGNTDQAFVARLKESARSYRFWPALANGCAVPATYEMVFDL